MDSIVIKSPIMPYAGSHVKVAEAMIMRFPPHRIYVEPFLGSGAVFLRHPLSGADHAVISDSSKFVHRVWKAVQDGSYETDFDMCLTMTRPKFEALVKKYKAGTISAPERILLSKFTYFSYMTDLRRPLEGERRCLLAEYKNTWKRIHRKLNLPGVHLLKSDYRKVVREADSPETFFYMDPPWLGNYYSARVNVAYDNEDAFDWEEFLDVLSGISGKFLLYHKHNRDLLRAAKERGFNIEHALRQSKNLGDYLVLGNYKWRTK